VSHLERILEYEQCWYSSAAVTVGGYNVLVDCADTDCRRLCCRISRRQNEHCTSITETFIETGTGYKASVLESVMMRMMMMRRRRTRRGRRG